MDNLDCNKLYHRPSHTPGRLVSVCTEMLPSKYLGKIGMLLSQFIDEYYIVLIGEEKLILHYDEFRLL